MYIKMSVGKSGISEYLITGKRKDVKDENLKDRDTKDEVVTLYGDLRDFAAVEQYTNENKRWNNHYLHITCSFTNEDMDILESAPNKNEILENIVKSCISHYTAGYDLENEVIAYAEAHYLKIKFEKIKNKQGEVIDERERFAHIHIGISLLNPQTNKQLRVDSMRKDYYFKAIDNYFKANLNKECGFDKLQRNPNRTKEYKTKMGNDRNDFKERALHFANADEAILWLESNGYKYDFVENKKNNYKYIKVETINKKTGEIKWVRLRGRGFKHLEINADADKAEEYKIDKDKYDKWRKERNTEIAKKRNDESSKSTQKSQESPKQNNTISYQNKIFYRAYKSYLKEEVAKQYFIHHKGNETRFTKPSDKEFEVLDTGDKLIGKGSNISEKVALMIDIAEAKKWDLSKLKIIGSDEFKIEAEKQLFKRIQAQLAKEPPKEVKLKPIKRTMTPLDNTINQHISKPNIEKIKKYFVNGKGKAIIDKFIDSHKDLKHLKKDNYQQQSDDKILCYKADNKNQSRTIIDFFTKEARIPFYTALAWLDKEMQDEIARKGIEQEQKAEIERQRIEQEGAKRKELELQTTQEPTQIKIDAQINTNDESLDLDKPKKDLEEAKRIGNKSEIQIAKQNLIDEIVKQAFKDVPKESKAHATNPPPQEIALTPKDTNDSANNEKDDFSAVNTTINNTITESSQTPQNREITTAEPTPQNDDKSKLINKDVSIVDKNTIETPQNDLADFNEKQEVFLNEIKGYLEQGYDINYQDNGITDLMFAAYKGYFKAVKFLLDNGANVNIQDNDGWTALDYAKQQGYTEIADLLIEAQQAQQQQVFLSQVNAILKTECKPYDNKYNISYPNAYKTGLDLETAIDLAKRAEKAELPYKILLRSQDKYRIVIADSSENVANLVEATKEMHPDIKYSTKSLDALKKALESQIEKENELKKGGHRRM